MKNLLKIISITIFLTGIIVFAQAIPPVSIFTPDHYNADNQNWSITQTEDKTMFFANSKGLLSFDGERWQLLGTPNNTILRSVYAVGNKVYSGAYMEFGVWQKDNTGQYEYTSLSDQIKLIDDEQFWHITSFKDYIVFQSLDAIYMYHLHKKQFQVFSSVEKYSKVIIKDNILYYHKNNKGLFKLVNGKEVAVNTSSVFKNCTLINLYSIRNIIYAQTLNNGILNINDNTLYIPKDKNGIYDTFSVYSSLQTDDGSIYLGTISSGVFLIKNNELHLHLNQKNALSNNTVLSVFEDQDKNMWLGLDNGINTVNVNSNITIFNDQDGMLGTVYASIISNNTLYLGTNQGLFYFDKKSNTYKIVKGTKGQVWSLYQHEGTLFCGHHNGTYIIKESTATQIQNKSGSWTFKALGSNTIISGNYQGLYVYKKKNNYWQLDRKIKGLDISTKYFEFINNHQILINHEYKGIYKISLDKDFKKILSIEKETSVEKGLYSSIIKMKDKVYYAYEKGIFYYDDKQSKFIKDQTLSSLYSKNNYSSGRLVTTKDDKIWVFNKTDLSYITLGSLENDYNITKIPISAESRNQISGYENIYQLKEYQYLLGNNGGYLQLNLIDKFNINPKIKLKQISSFNKTNQSLSISPKPTPKALSYEYNNLKFSLTSNNYNAIYNSQYQYKLENYNNNWSNWSSNSTIIFKNLPSGKYTFKARSRIGESNESKTIQYSFRIKRPIHLSNLMLFFYCLVFALIILFVIFLQRKNFNKKTNRLEAESQKKLKLKELENEKEIMLINNDKLKIDIENKNRELAISTMSLIKKNEFLAQIKNELKPLQQNSIGVKKVIKTINNNINNVDDWKFFEEAFNNADKNFFNKLKNYHPSLTPNELKLCAYLRLNLSTKEIAPLFNISPKSIEIKRYRLRKKMKLERSQSLTNYILEL